MEFEIQKSARGAEPPPGDGAAFEASARELEKNARWQDLADLYEQRAQALPDAADLPALLLRAGDLFRARLGNLARAEDCYRRVLAASPDQLSALEGVAAIAAAKGDVLAQASAIERIAIQKKGADAAAVLMDLGALYEKAQRRDRAALAYHRAARAVPSDRRALKNARAALLALGRDAQAFESLESERKRFGPAGLAVEYAEIAARLADEPARHELAHRAAAAALEIEPGNRAAADATQALAAYKSNWRDKTRALRARALEERDRRRAATLYLAIAQAHAVYDPDPVGGKQKVKEFLDRAFLLWPGMPPALEFLEQYAEKFNDFKTLEVLFDRLAANVNERAAAADLYLRLASVRMIRFGDRAGALEALTRAAALDPTRGDAVALAAEIHLDDKHYTEAKGVLERHLDTLSDPREQSTLRLTLADLLSQRLGDFAGARVHLETVLRVDPVNQKAAAALVPVYEKSEEWPRLAQVLEVAIKGVLDPAEKVRILEQLGEVLGDRLNRPLEAVRALGRALLLEPSRAKVRKLLDKYAQTAAVPDEHVRVLKAAAQGAKPVTAKILWRRVAEVLEGANRLAEAAHAYRTVCELDPDDQQAAQAAEALLARTGAHKELREGFEKQLERARSKPERRAILDKMVQALEREGADPSAAIPIYRQILDIDPKDVSVLKRLGAAAANLEQWAEVAAVAARMAELTEDSAEALEWRARLAHLYAERLGEKAKAAEIYLGILADDPHRTDVVPHLERLAAAGVNAEAIARALAPVYLAGGDHHRAAGALAVQLEATRKPKDRVRILLDLARLHEEELADRRAAFSFCARAVKEDPAAATPLAELDRIGRELGAPADLARAYADVAEACRDKAAARKLRLASARVSEEARDEALAFSALNRLLAEDPDDAEALALLHAVAVRAGRWDEVEKVLLRQLQGAPKRTRRDLSVELAEVYERTDRPAQAAQALLDALEAGADEGAVLPRLSRAYELAGRVDLLVESLGREMALAEHQGDQDRAARIALKKAKLLGDQLGDRATAVTQYAEVLARRPSDPDALAGLEAMLQDPNAREAAARALAPACEATKDFRKLVSVLEVLSECAAAPSDRVTILRRIAQVHAAELRAPDQAFAALVRAFALAPGDAQVRGAARKSAEEAGAMAAYAREVERIAAAVPPAERPPVLRELAEVSERHLSDRAKALEAYGAILAADRENLDALRGLHRLYRQAGAYAELARVCEALAPVVYESAEKVALWREAGALREGQLADADAAARAYQAILSIDPRDKDAAKALERLYERLGRHTELSGVLKVRRSQEGASPQGREIAFKLAELSRTALGDAAAAIALFGEVLTADPSHAGARASLEAWAASGESGAAEAMKKVDPVLARAGEHLRRVRIREARLEGADAQAQAALAAEIRRLYEEELSQPELAFVAAARAFADKIARAAVRPDLERLGQKTQSFEEMAEVYERAAQEDPPDRDAVTYVRRAAEIREQLGETERAVQHYQRVLQFLPNDPPALDALARLYEKGKSAKELSEIYRQKAALTGDKAEKAHLLFQAAQAKEQLAEDDEAVALLRDVLALDPGRTAALEALDRVLGRTKSPKDHADVLRLLAERSAEAPARRGYQLRRAAILEKLGEAGEAVAVYAAVLADSPGEAQAIAGIERLFATDAGRTQAVSVLEPHYRSIQDARRLADVLEAKLAMGAAPDRRAALLEIARLREQVGQRPAAFTALLRAFREDPAEAKARAELERLAAETGAFEELAASYEDELEGARGGPLELELWQRLATIYADRLALPDRAAKAYEEIARRSPTDRAPLEALVRLYGKTNALRELAEVYRRLAELERSLEKKKDLLFTLAALCEEKLSDKPGAVAAYQAVRAIDPEDNQTLKSLSRLLQETESWAGLADLIAASVGIAETRGLVEQALELRIKLGRLKLAKLKDPRGALTLYSEVMAKRSGHPAAVAALDEMARGEGSLRAEAALALEPVFSASGDYPKLVQLLETRLPTATPPEKSQLLRKIAEIYAGPLGSPEMAFVSASRALKELPDDRPALEAAQRYVDAAQAHEELAALLGEVAERAHSEASRAEIHRALAQLAQGPLNEIPRAIAAWQKVLEAAPSDAGALAELARIHRETGDGEALLEIYKRQLSLAEDVDKRVELLFKIGEVQDERLRDYAGAIVAFRRLLELTPNDALALERLDRLCVRQERWAELADVLSREVELSRQHGDKEQEVTLLYRMAQVREQRLLDRTGAMALYESILAVRPDHEETLARVEAIAQKEPAYDEAAQALLAAYQATGNFAKHAALLDARIAVAPDRAARKTLLVELARVRADRQERPELAFLALCRAFREDPDDPALRKDLERMADRSEGHEELAALYEEQFPEIAEASQASDVALTVAKLMDTRLEQPDAALKYYERARNLDPSRAPQALPALDRLYKAKEDWPHLADVLAELSAVAEDPAEKAAVLFRLGQLADEKLGQRDRAAHAFEAILSIDPKHLPGLRALERLYDQARQHDKLYRALEAQRPLLTGPERERVTARLAEVAATGLNDPNRAIALYQELLEKNPRSEAASLALEGLFEDTSRWQDLSDLVRKRLSLTVDPREITRLNDKLGRTMARLGKAEEAIAGFKAALERDPRHRRALESLREIYEIQGAWEELGTVLRRLIPLQDSPAGVKEVRLKLAQVLLRMNRREDAIEAARRAMDVEPHTEKDLARAEETFRQLGAFADAVRCLELRAQSLEAAGDIDGAVAVYFQVAETYARDAKKPEAGLGAYEKILEIKPASRDAFDALRNVAAAASDWRRYVSALDRFLPSLEDKAEKVRLLADAARVQEEKLGQKTVAFASLTRAFAENPADQDVRASMHRLAEETASWEELAAVYETVVDEVEKGPVAERLYLALAKIQDANLDDPAEAEATWRKVLEFDPANQAALEGLAAMFARRGRDREYVVALEQKLEVVASLEERKAILCDIAKVYDERLANLEEAAQTYRRALDLEPDARTIELLADLYRRERKFADLADLLLRARDLQSDPESRAAMQVQVAEVYEKEIGDDEAAVAGFRQALEFDPANRVALASLERLYTKLDRSAELLQVYDGQLRVTTDNRERTKVLFKCAGIWEDKYQNLANSDACLESVLAFDPGNLGAIRGLERLRRADGRWDDLIRALEQHVSLTAEVGEKVELLVSMGDVWYQEIKRLDRAATIYHEALELDPASVPAMHALGLLYERSGNWPFALDMLSREAGARGATPEAVELFHRIGKINEEMLLDTAAAKAAYQQAVLLNAGYLPSLRALKGLYEGEGDNESYLTTLVQEAQYTEDPEHKTKALCQVASFYLDRREDGESAAKYLEEAAKLSPESLEVAKPLADIYVAAANWERAEANLHIVTQKLGEVAALDPKVGRELCSQYYRLGYVAEKRARHEVALSAYERAYQLDATYLHAAEGYANLLVAGERFDDALKVYQGILIHHREELSDLEVVELYWRIGDLYRKLKAADRAQKEFEKALAIDGSHEPSRRALVEILEEQGNYEAAIEHRHSLLDVLTGPDKVEMAVGIGRISKEKLGDPYQAIDAYLTALKVSPDSAEILAALLDLYRDTRQASKAVESLEKLVDLPDVAGDPQEQKKRLHQLGEIARDEAKDEAKALVAWNRALDLDPKFVQPFVAIEQLLVARKQWKPLEENYARMLKRLPKTEDTHAARMTLWKTLGELYQKVLKDPNQALQAYRVVVMGSPDDVATLEAYANLAAEQPGREAEAIEAYRKALATTANPTGVARALVRLHATAKQYDEAYAAAQVVAHLIGDPGTEEREILGKLGPYAKRRENAQKPMTDRLWTELLYHPKVRGPIGEILALVHEQFGAEYAQKPSEYGFEPRAHRINVDTSEVAAIKTYREVLHTLNMDALELYSPYLTMQLDRQRGKVKPGPTPDPDVFLELCHTAPLSLKAGKRLFAEDQQAALRFFLAKHLAFSRSELALARLFPIEQLEVVFQAAVQAAVPSFRVTADPRAVDEERRRVERRLPEAAQPALTRLSRAYLGIAPLPDVRSFVEGVEHTANRAGMLLAADVEAAKNCLKQDPGGAARLPLRAKSRDLMLFCMSPEYAKLRAALGINIEIRVPGKT